MASNLTPTDVKTFVDKLKVYLKQIESVAALIPAVGPELLTYSAVVDEFVASIEPFVEEQWFCDVINVVDGLITKKITPTQFAVASKAFTDAI